MYQWINEWINESMNESMNQWMNQSIKQSSRTGDFEHFLKKGEFFMTKCKLSVKIF